ncbi:methyltransferase domain-containing protein [Haliea sp. E1-2-M8]|uniref:class I SAM-dependent methyltransferase n=1 Tax=Haliea sp. E1-2-M8 TaxID=3064706 RepID=UPI0027196EF5|nr:methyltransferase domain-containing protein [Haliea sp. E1-2-M8]MDO8861667.1 methyltransferase domain-containing protein [Haliea sp. E1-2-M8]
MKNSIDERFQYHPDPKEVLSNASFSRSLRRVDLRKAAIMESVELRGKSLLDLGCSGGYFGFSLAGTIKLYHGVDGDNELIARNIEVSQSKGLNHLSFEHSRITPDFIRQLPSFDVVFFLSVFHHILAVSKAYDWNEESVWEPEEILRALAEKAEVLVFETGYPSEGHEWCENLPPMLPTPDAWIVELLRGAGFYQVEIIPSPVHSGILGRVRASLGDRFNVQKQNPTVLARLIARAFHLDPRDRRDIFIAHKRRDA